MSILLNRLEEERSAVAFYKKIVDCCQRLPKRRKGPGHRRNYKRNPRRRRKTCPRPLRPGQGKTTAALRTESNSDMDSPEKQDDHRFRQGPPETEILRRNLQGHPKGPDTGIPEEDRRGPARRNHRRNPETNPSASNSWTRRDGKFDNMAIVEYERLPDGLCKTTFIVNNDSQGILATDFFDPKTRRTSSDQSLK